ncbi:MAG: DedA family protein [Candidatus Sumerlaeota bacterium]|nr:DedA family protein [Candidatus Sumerlaeota bacterium]
MVDMFLKLDVTLGEIIRQYGNWTYGIMFMIVFCETGLVITPILPGDTLLFVAGTFAGISELNLWLMLLLLSVAAILGDTVNYWIGHFLGDEILKRRLIKQKYLDRTHEFFERYGGKTIVIARFVPIVRTIAPFVAGLGSMNYRKFIIYNIAGGIGWVVSITLVGYFFGNIPFIKKNLTAAIMIIVVLSMLPGVFEYWRQRRELAKAKR